MKRFLIHDEQVSSWQAVASASRRAARGKRNRAEVVAFFAHADDALARVSAALRGGRLPRGTFRRFVIHDPKRREITAAPFEDRVAHHAIVQPLVQPLDTWLAATSFACRPGKGVHAAVRHVQRQCCRYPVYLKMDVCAYFERIDHARLRALLQRRLKGGLLFDLLDAVLASFSAVRGRGLPIGALTSQQFANVYLNPADQWLLAHPHVRAHCRYMDDTVVWCESTREARELFTAYQDYLHEHWALTLKAPVIQRSRHGIGFCGYRVSPGKLRPSRRRLQRCKTGLHAWQAKYLAGDIDALQLQQITDALLAMLLPGESTGWRRDLLARGLPVVDS
ncbi:MAG: RNA-directed DNA polymerase [Pseudomonadota bacterium]